VNVIGLTDANRADTVKGVRLEQVAALGEKLDIKPLKEVGAVRKDAAPKK
jgi:hypothetical protein